MSKHHRDCVRICEQAGLSVLQISFGGKHLKVVCAQGTVVCPSTPSDHRWVRQLRAFARRLANDR